MIFILDSNSMLSLVRYYIKIDKNEFLLDFFKSKFKSGELLIIDKVYNECSYLAKGLVLKDLHFLKNKDFLKTYKVPYKTNSIIAPAPKKFLRQIDNSFINTVVIKQKKISDIEYEIQKNRFLESADIKQITLALNFKKEGQDVSIVTEETEYSNDNKIFKKIPAMCKELEITTITLPELLIEFNLQMNFSL